MERACTRSRVCLINLAILSRLALIKTAIEQRGADILKAYFPALKDIDANLVALYSRSLKTVTEGYEEAKKYPGLCSPDFEIYHDEQGSSGVDGVLKRDDVTAVVVSLPTTVQPTVVLKALAAGKHVLMEKPLAKDIQTSEMLISEYEKTYRPKGLILAVAEQFRYDAGHDKIRDTIASGDIGALTAVHLRLWQLVVPGNKWYETEWRKTPEYQGGFLLDGGVHFVALLRHATSDEIVETASFAKQTLDHLPPLDTVHAALRFKKGALGTLSISFASAKTDYSCVFIGDKGSITVAGEAKGLKVHVQDAAEKTLFDEVVESNDTYKTLFAAFLNSAETGKEDPRGSPRQALADVAVVESICNRGGSVDK